MRKNIAGRKRSGGDVCVPFSLREWTGSSLLRRTGSRPGCWWCRTSRPLQRAAHKLQTRNCQWCQELRKYSLTQHERPIEEKNTLPENRFSVSGIHFFSVQFQSKCPIKKESVICLQAATGIYSAHGSYEFTFHVVHTKTSPNRS